MRFWNEDKGFGFIIPKCGGDDIWVHRSSLLLASQLSPGDKVSYIRVDDGKGTGGFKGLKVRVLQCAEEGSTIFSDLDLPLEDECGTCLQGLDLLLDVAVRDGELPATASTPSQLKEFIMESSLGCPFLVLSEGQFVEGVRAPTPEEFDALLVFAEAFAMGLELKHATLIADFEGELPGFGGVLTTAQFQLTSTLDPDELVPRPVPRGQLFRSPGVLVDLRNERCIGFVRHLMESPAITKVIWGAINDCQGLLYQKRPVSLCIDPSCVVDVQLAYSGGRNRMGMAAMLQDVRQELLEGIPDKEQIDWDAFHSRNEQALQFPLQRSHALYAVDDMHRIEAIIGSKSPPGGTYAGALDATENNLRLWRADVLCLGTLRERRERLERLEGARKMTKAVETMRHVIALRATIDASAGSLTLSAEDEAFVAEAQDAAGEILREAEVVVPEDLSFQDPDL